MNDLSACLQQLEQSRNSIYQAVDTIIELENRDCEDELLGDAPVFTSLSIPVIARLLQQIRTMYGKELLIKRAVIRDFEDCCNSALTYQQSPLHSRHDSKVATEGYLQVHITAWMVCVEVADGIVEHDVRRIQEDSKSC